MERAQLFGSPVAVLNWIAHSYVSVPPDATSFPPCLPPLINLLFGRVLVHWISPATKPWDHIKVTRPPQS
jgi:hypothetical protein